ncbi:type 2 isopentenyl-diphosphate Delta-isomerase [Aneurinibacillus terranovensis]|uniref:type 2 isopentenyl-diphosphate Delta-isomerase n=1 Tax=Aneurinibacillus terranovensis TaxID=278991 RepID=UPI0003F82453|nr:type 2 isopentenyl-diphosphate Delta-isomerase [Aneurinibacillus terranovensis]
MSRISRKKEHIDLALSSGQSGQHGLYDVKFVHDALPDLALSDVSYATTIGGLTLSSPIVINAMTGGAEEAVRINRALGMIARRAGLAIAVGSQMAAVKNPALAHSYHVVRSENPDGIVLANLGAEATPDMAKQAVDMIEANGLQIHLNVMQELIMPEGERDFTGAAKRIQAIVQAVAVPVIVKEVGFGISRETALRLAECGVAAIDVGGRGGTNFASIENERRDSPYDILNDWGISTAASLLETVDARGSGRSGGRFDIIATGGIRTAMDVARSLALGANGVGMAGPFLQFAANENIDGAYTYICTLHEQLSMIMCALGATSLAALQRIPLVITGETYHWAKQRGIDSRLFAGQNGITKPQ